MKKLLLAALLLAPALHARAADDTTSSAAPVKAVAPSAMPLRSPRGGVGNLPLYLSADWTRPQPGITRALLIFHGKLRNADTYNSSGETAIRAAGAAGQGTLLITPQFLAPVDINAFHLPPPTLRWAPEAWMGGGDSLNAAVSSFDAIDAILAQLGNKRIFPNLKTVVLAGHSGGAQVVQRYAVVGRGGDALFRSGVHVRYVIANPSSYVYFSPERPDLEARPALDSKDSFTFGPPRKSCMGHYDLWKYGMHDLPPYLGEHADPAELEARYLRRDVLYLLGTNDTDPDHPALDKTCSAEVEGPFRFFRGKAYFAYLTSRHAELASPSASQQLWFVPGVEHDGDKMLTSPCGLAALFSTGTCPTRTLEPKP